MTKIEPEWLRVIQGHQTPKERFHRKSMAGVYYDILDRLNAIARKQEASDEPDKIVSELLISLDATRFVRIRRWGAPEESGELKPNCEFSVLSSSKELMKTGGNYPLICTHPELLGEDPENFFSYEIPFMWRGRAGGDNYVARPARNFGPFLSEDKRSLKGIDLPLAVTLLHYLIIDITNIYGDLRSHGNVLESLLDEAMERSLTTFGNLPRPQMAPVENRAPASAPPPSLLLPPDLAEKERQERQEPPQYNTCISFCPTAPATDAVPAPA